MPCDEGSTRVDDSEGAFEVNEADAQEQRTDAGGAGPADAPADPEAAVGALSGRDLDTALDGANEADLVEQAQEVPYDDDFDR
jgi:hypothetical protein